jgi:hypothetical protein
VKPLQVDLPYLSEEPDRHGNIRLYVRRYGRRIRLPAERGSKEFPRAYQEALDSLSEFAPQREPSLSSRPHHGAPWAGSLPFISDPMSSERWT